MKKILVTYDMFREGFTELEKLYDVTFPDGRDFTYEEVYEMIPEYDVLCSMFDFPVNKKLVDHAPKLKLVSNYAVGYNNIDVAYCLEKGITVTNTPGPVTAPTANIALGLMLDTARRITECDRKLRRLGKQMKVGVLENLGIPIEGKTLGIIGMGRIGQALAKRAVACNMNILYHNRHRLTPEKEAAIPARYVSKEELLNQEFMIPDEVIAKWYNNIAQNFDNKIAVLDQQLNLLIKARDRLLPKMMSGEVEV